MRSDGTAAASAVASAISSGAVIPASAASANQRSNWTCGSGSRSCGIHGAESTARALR